MPGSAFSDRFSPFEDSWDDELGRLQREEQKKVSDALNTLAKKCAEIDNLKLRITFLEQQVEEIFKGEK